jgi:hypothetical protein
MLIFLGTMGLLALFLGVHVVVWRVRPPRKQFASLLVILGVVFMIALAAAVLISIPVLTFLHIALFYVSAALCYIVLFSAIYKDSPTLSLVRFIAEKPVDGRSTVEVVDFLARRPFVKGRLTELAESGLILEQNGKFVASGKGSLGFRFILSYRKLYGHIPTGG